MEILIQFLSALLPFCYFAVMYVYGVDFFKSPKWTRKYMGLFLKTTIVIHLVEVSLHGIFYKYFPLSTIFEVASIISLAVVLIYQYIEYYLKIKTTGFFVIITAFVLQLFSSVFISFGQEIPAILENSLFVSHASLAILGYSAFFISALYALMYLLLFHQIKSAQFGIVYRRMPSLEELNEMNFRAAIVGFLFLTGAIFLGLIWRNMEFPGSGHFDPKVTISYLVWVIYGLVIFGRRITQWSGKLLAQLALFGFLIILISMTIINWLVSSFHNFG